jgi:holo-[acyl-carrier protein] synthase
VPCLTDHEKKYCEKKKRSLESLAARMAAKLAFWDALGVSGPEERFPPGEWKKIEVERKKPGPPALAIDPSLGEKLGLSGRERIHVSLTHEREFAMAAVLIED